MDLSTRAKWIVTGTDAARYLNGQVTNDVRKAATDSSIYACLTNAKGRVEGDVFIHLAPEGDALLLDGEPGLRQPLRARLEKYIVADDVEVRDVTDEWGLLHFLGPMRERWRDHCVPGSHAVRVARFGEDGWDLWLPAGDAPRPVPAGLLDDEEAETLRVLRGVPRWPEELNPEVFPQEAGLEQRAMDFSKGCYVGQEVLSRIKLTGRMPRKLVRIRLNPVDAGSPGRNPRAAPADPGKPWRLLTQETETLREAGVVTSLCRHPELDRLVGLAYVPQGRSEEESRLLASQDPPTIVAKVEILRP